MSGVIGISLGEPEAGWLPVELHGGDTIVSFAGSYIYPSLETLVTALHSLLLVDGTQTAVWLAEPTEYEMQFSRNSELVALTVQEYPDRRRTLSSGKTLLTVSGSYQEIALPFWRALRGLQGRYVEAEWERRWGRAFPTEDMSRWTTALQQQELVAR